MVIRNARQSKRSRRVHLRIDSGSVGGFPIKRALLLLLLLLLGGASNYGVAWSRDIWVGMLPSFARQNSRSIGAITVIGKDADRLVYWTILREDSLAASCIQSVAQSPPTPLGAGIPVESVLPAWSRISKPSIADRSWQLQVAVGWPFLALTFKGRRPPVSSEYKWSDALLIGASKRNPNAWPLPLRPIWPGFLINTVIYAALLWLIPLLVRYGWVSLVTRHMRKSHGLCPNCAYPRGSSDICTECGLNLATCRTFGSPWLLVLITAALLGVMAWMYVGIVVPDRPFLLAPLYLWCTIPVALLLLLLLCLECRALLLRSK